MTPPGVAWQDRQITYAYDLFDQLTNASDATYGHVFNQETDPLGRLKWENDPWRGKHMYYDLVGRMTRLNYGDGFFVDYAYDKAGRMTSITDGSGAQVATFHYDDFGRRIYLNRSGGLQTVYAWDGASRLIGANQIFNNGSSANNSMGFSYNPASQITERVSSNDAYAWNQGVSAYRNYGVNSLNQYTSAGATTFGYDGRGNLTNSGGTAYGYTSQNQMAWAGDSNRWFFYDAVGRLDIDAAAGQLFSNLGSQMVAELDSSNGATLRHYVYGPGTDEVLFWYEGTGYGDRRALMSDERGSITAVANSAGQPMAYNAYDEYGIPKTTNLGRFGYTGQQWNPTTGMFHYKARAYSPTLGRFLQTDPIGYGDGMNMYAYVGNDPVNERDPFGLRSCAVGVEGYGMNRSPNCGGGGGGLGGGSGINGTVDSTIPPPNPYGCESAQRFGIDPDTCVDPYGRYPRVEEPQNDEGGDIVVTGRRQPPVRIAGALPNIGLAGLPGLGSGIGEGDRDRAAERDYEICRSLSSPAARARCWASAAERDGARAAGRPVPPLVTERGIAPPPLIPLPNPRCLRLRHPVLIGGCMIFTS